MNYYKLERICNVVASQFVIIYYKLEQLLQIETQHTIRTWREANVNRALSRHKGR